ncbi:5727_t:CDS:2 [Paraglomus brasilianum]|uniref:5727_t:CDS:1 n=1 Tax=Paraglomus brasilianum TaxID=144538 RepID=A0A9N9AJG9_9GLOM|nr:5727_t:CDS:2 [Paraglomus brasilianum]
MDVQQERISQILATVKCSDCGVPVEFRKLSSHICKAAPAVPNLPATFKNNMGSSTGLNPGGPMMFPGIKKLDNNNNSRPTLNPISVPGQNPYNAYGQPPRSPISPRSPYENPPSMPVNTGYSGMPANYNNPPEASRISSGNSPNTFLKKYNKLTGKSIESSTNQFTTSPVEAPYSDNSRTDYFGNSKFPEPSVPRAGPYQPNSNGVGSNQGNTFNNNTANNSYNPRGQYTPERNRDVYGVDKTRDQPGADRMRDQYRANGDQPGTDRMRDQYRTKGDQPGTDRMRDQYRANEDQPGADRMRDQYRANGDQPGADRMRDQYRTNGNQPGADRMHDQYRTNGNQPGSDRMRDQYRTNGDQPGSDRKFDQYRTNGDQPGSDRRFDQYHTNDNLNPNDRHNNARDWVRGERNDYSARSRSPGGYDRSNDRSDYDRNYNPPNPNQLQSNTEYDHSRRPSYERQNNYQQYGYENNNRQPPVRKASNDPNNIPSSGPYLPSSSPEHNRTPSASGSLSSLSSTQSSRGRKFSGDTVSTANTQNTGGVDTLMDDLLKEMSSLSTSSMSEHDSQNKAYHSRNASATSDICAYCNGPILSNPLRALNKLWHPHHLLCARCNKPIDPDVGHVEKNDKVYCPHDFTDLFLPKCRACNRPVEKAVSSSDGKLEGKWHASCFCCQTCRKPFPNKSFYVFNNAPYCKRHYHKLNNSLCKNCDDPIEGPCAQTVEGWRYHPSCFTCFICHDPLTDTYYNFEDHQYCETHIMEIQQRKQIRAEKRQTMFHILR